METKHVPLAGGAEAERLIEQVRDRYGSIASGKEKGCCGPTCCAPADAVDPGALSTGIGYSKDDLAAIPEEANLGLGCGAPLAFLDLQPGEVVLDLGSGAGMDAFLAARKVGRSGRVIGVDMTPEMLARARAAATRHGLAQVEFREGRLERLPVVDASVDAVTSNCVINLVPDKTAVFAEIARVLRPGGVCYFSAGNRYAWMEPHYRLPLLSVVPKPVAHLYLRLCRRGRHYYEAHSSYWGLRRLVASFELVDYTRAVVAEPTRYASAYLVPPGSLKQRVALFILDHARWLSPGYIWILRKPTG